MAEIFRAPLIAPLRRALARVGSFDPPNILLSTLVATFPFNTEQDWAAPKRAPYVHREFDPPNLLLGTLVPPAPALPVGSQLSDKALPSKAKAASFDPPNILLSELVPTIPFFEPQWPSALKAKPKAKEFDPPNIAFSTLVVTRPFLNWDFRLPTRVRLKALITEPPNPSNALLYPVLANYCYTAAEGTIVTPTPAEGVMTNDTVATQGTIVSITAAQGDLC